MKERSSLLGVPRTCAALYSLQWSSGGTLHHLLYFAYLVKVVLAGEERFVVDHLPEDAANTPDIQRLAVALQHGLSSESQEQYKAHLSIEHRLRRAVPAGSNVLCQHTLHPALIEQCIRSM